MRDGHQSYSNCLLLDVVLPKVGPNVHVAIIAQSRVLLYASDILPGMQGAAHVSSDGRKLYPHMLMGCAGPP